MGFLSLQNTTRQAVKQLNELSTFNESDIIVMIFPDHGSRYMSKIYNDDWMYEQGFMDKNHNVCKKPIQFIK